MWVAVVVNGNGDGGRRRANLPASIVLVLYSRPVYPGHKTYPAAVRIKVPVARRTRHHLLLPLAECPAVVIALHRATASAQLSPTKRAGAQASRHDLPYFIGGLDGAGRMELG